MQLCSVTYICNDSTENNAFITLYLPPHAISVDADGFGGTVDQVQGTYASLTAPGLCKPRFLQLPSDKEKQAAYRKLEARFSQIRQDDLHHISYVGRTKFKTLEYFCDQIDTEHMPEADRNDLKRFCEEVRQEYQILEERVEEFLVYLHKPFEQAKLSTIKSRATLMLGQEKMALGTKENWERDVVRRMLTKEIYGLLRVTERSRFEMSRMTEDLITSVLAAITSYERESATWIEVFDNVTRDVLDD